MPKRYGKHKTQQLKIEKNLTEKDKSELKKFSEYLKDTKMLSKKELIEKHGQYMGFSEEELKELKEKMK